MDHSGLSRMPKKSLGPTAKGVCETYTSLSLSCREDRIFRVRGTYKIDYFDNQDDGNIYYSIHSLSNF
jgi:hypothetical protein